MAACLDAEQLSHPCAEVIGYQWQSIDAGTRTARWRGAHQLPEPWAGHLSEAPILFVSSNPSIRGQFALDGLAAPTRDGITWNDSDEEIIDRFENAFDNHIVDERPLERREARYPLLGVDQVSRARADPGSPGAARSRLRVDGTRALQVTE